jgi:hypothetical protein
MSDPFDIYSAPITEEIANAPTIGHDEHGNELIAWPTEVMGHPIAQSR